MKLTVLMLGLLLMQRIASGQQTVKEPHNMLFFSPGLSYQGELFGDVNLMYANTSRLDGASCSGPAAVGPRLGLEFNMKPSNLVLVPKIGYEYSGNLVCLRANALYYISKQQKGWRLLGEVGLSLSGYINLTYGYVLPFQQSMDDEFNASRIGITINLAKKLSKQFSSD